MRQKCVVIAAERAQNEFGHAGVNIFGNAREYRIGVADRERVCGVTPGALGVSIHRLGDSRRVLAAEVEREAGAIVIFVDGSAGLAGGGLDRSHDATGIGRRVAACQPVPMRAVRRIAASVEPPIHIGRSGCTGLGAMVTPFSW